MFIYLEAISNGLCYDRIQLSKANNDTCDVKYKCYPSELSVVISLIQIVVGSIVSVENFIRTQIKIGIMCRSTFHAVNVLSKWQRIRSLKKKNNGKLHSIITPHNETHWELQFTPSTPSSVHCKALEHRTPMQFSNKLNQVRKMGKMK